MKNNLNLQKVRLISYEQHFQDKVDEVDNKYKAQIDDLMVQNAELRYLRYLRNCNQSNQNQQFISFPIGNSILQSVADPRFPRLGGGWVAPTPDFGVKTYYLARF